MTRKIIDIGSGESVGDGEPIRNAFDKINQNFTELYNISSTTQVINTPPENPLSGQLWYDTTSGRLYVYYNDTWVDTSSNSGTNALIYTGSTPPLDPVPNELWFNTQDGKIYIRYSSTWIDTSIPASSNVGTFSFDGNKLQNLSGSRFDNGDFQSGSTAALVLPVNGAEDTNTVLFNLYGSVLLKTGNNTGSFTSEWRFDKNGILTLPHSNYLETTDINLAMGSQGEVVIRSNAADNINDKVWTFGADGVLDLPNTIHNYSYLQTPHNIPLNIQTTGDDIVQVQLKPGTTSGDGFQIYTNGGGWLFGASGNLTIPTDGKIKDANSYLTVENINIQGSIKDVTGSTGSTDQILSRASNGGVQWINNTGGGVGYQLTRGDFIAEIDSDGYFRPPFNAYIGETQTSVVYSNVNLALRTVDKDWYFDVNGTMTMPGVEDDTTAVVDFFAAGANNHKVTLASDWTMKIKARADGANQGHLWLEAGQNTKIKVNGNGSTIDVVTGDGTTTATWTFRNDGVLQVPGPDFISWIYQDEVGLALQVDGYPFVFGKTGNITLPAAGDITRNGVSVIGLEPSFSYQDQTFTAVAGKRYAVDNQGAQIGAILPASPTLGDAIYFVDAKGTFSGSAYLTISGNGHNVMGASTQNIITANESIGVFWNGTEWRYYG